MDQTRAWNYKNETILVQGGRGEATLDGFPPSLGFHFGYGRSFNPLMEGGAGPCATSSQCVRTGQSLAWKMDHNSKQPWQKDGMVQNQEKTLHTGQSQGRTSGLSRGKWPDKPGGESDFLQWNGRLQVIVCMACINLPTQMGATWRCLYVSITLTLDFFRQIMMKKSSDNSKKKNVWGSSGVAHARVIIVLSPI